MENLEQLLNQLPPFVLKDRVPLFLYMYKDDENNWRITYDLWGQKLGFWVEKRPTLREAAEDMIVYLRNHPEIKKGITHENNSN